MEAKKGSEAAENSVKPIGSEPSVKQPQLRQRYLKIYQLVWEHNALTSIKRHFVNNQKCALKSIAFIHIAVKYKSYCSHRRC